VIAGGGVGGLEAALALHELAPGRLATELITPEEEFVHRPLAVAEPFGLADVTRFALDRILGEGVAARRRDSIAEVDPESHEAVTAGGRRVPYDALVLAIGVRPEVAIKGALTYRGPADNSAYRDVLAGLEAGELHRIAFAIPATVRWGLPLYELALLTARHARESGIEGVELTLVTAEPEPLAMFGHRAARNVRDLLGGAGVAVHTSAAPAAVEGTELRLVSGETLATDRVIASPRLEVDPIPGIPQGPHGFIGTDVHMKVEGLPRVFAVGDATWFPIKQGGLAAQQADVAATYIAGLAGADVERTKFRPVLRGALITGETPRYLRTEIGDRDGVSAAGGAPLWWPPSKIAARFLAPRLAALAGSQAGPPLTDVEAPEAEELARAEADHADAVELALGMADADAIWGDYLSALRWLDLAEELDFSLPSAYVDKRREWTKAAGQQD